jgi:hypothetical protein
MIPTALSPRLPPMARSVPSAALALGLTFGASAATADCGRNAIPRDTVWFLTFTSVSPFVCELTFTNQRGNYTALCAVFNGPTPTEFTATGRISVNNQCAFNGTFVVDDARGAETLMVGQLWSADLGDANGPDAGSGMFYGDSDSGPAFVPIQLTRRSFDHAFPRLGDFLSTGN